MIKDYKTTGKTYIGDPDELSLPDDDPYYASEDDDSEEDGFFEDEKEEEVPDSHTGKLDFFREKARETAIEAKSPAYVLREKERKRDRFRFFIVLASLAAALVAAIALYLTNYEFTTYSVDASFTLGTASGAKLVSFCGGDLIIGSDAVTYVKNDAVVWTAPVNVIDPICAIEGNYFALAGKGSYQFLIFDVNGILSTVRVSRKIRAIDVSQSGVTAVATESQDTAYVSYFDRYGSRISVEVKTVLDASGYPVSISISPDGQKLLVIYYSIANGIGESRLVVYDFQNGKADRSYIVASYEDFYDTDTYLADACFIDDRHAIAVGDNELVFLSDFVKGNVSRETVRLTETIRSLAFTSSGLCLITRDPEVRFYRTDGSMEESFRAPENYDEFIVSDRYAAFRDGNRLTLYNISGVLRYEGELTYEPESFAFASGRSLIFNTGTDFQKITLK